MPTYRDKSAYRLVFDSKSYRPRPHNSYECPPELVLHGARLSKACTTMATHASESLRRLLLTDIHIYLTHINSIKLKSGSRNLTHLFHKTVQQYVFVLGKLVSAVRARIADHDELCKVVEACDDIFEELLSKTPHPEDAAFRGDWICLTPHDIQCLDFMHREDADKDVVVPDNFSSLKFQPHPSHAALYKGHTQSIGRPQMYNCDLCCKFVTKTKPQWSNKIMAILEENIRDEWIAKEDHEELRRVHQLICSTHVIVQGQSSPSNPSPVGTTPSLQSLDAVKHLDTVKHEVDKRPGRFRHGHQWVAIHGIEFDFRLRCTFCYCKYGPETASGLTRSDADRGDLSGTIKQKQKAPHRHGGCCEDAAYSVVMSLERQRITRA